jgi:hypothetical protein
VTEEEAPVRTSLVVARATAVGLISTIPIVGPVLGELVAAFIPDVRFRRVERLAQELKEKVTQVSDRLDGEYVRREEFAVLFEDALERATQARNDQKTAAFAAFMAHSMTFDRPSLADRQRYLDILDQLRPVHLQILAVLADGSGPEPASPPFTVGQAAATALSAVLAKVEGADWQDLADLERRGLTRAMGESSLLIATNVRNTLLPLGSAFLAFVAAEAPTAHRSRSGRRRSRGTKAGEGTPENATGPSPRYVAPDPGSDLPHAPVTGPAATQTEPAVHLELRYHGNSQKLELANDGTEPIFDVTFELPPDAAPLTFQGGFPIHEIPAGRSVNVTAIRLLSSGPDRTSFHVRVRGRTADNRQVDQDAFLDLLG